MSAAGASSLRLAGAGVLAVCLVAAGALIGARLWPGVVRIEQRVVAPANGGADAGRRADGIADLVDRLCPAIVALDQPAPPPPRAAPGGAAAGAAGAAAGVAGFLISADGYLVTGAGAAAGQDPVRVTLNDGRAFAARPVAADPVSGLALFKVDATGLPFLTFAAARFPRVGDRGIALASPNGTGCLAQDGMISVDFVAEQAGLRSYVRVRPALDPRPAGMPVVNPDGQVVGVVTGGADADTAAGSPLLPAGTAARIAGELMRDAAQGANRFGVVADDLLPELAARLGADRQRGAVVALVRPGSPGALAGLKAGDVILSASDEPISGASELARALDTGDRRVSLTILRRSRRLTLDLEAR